jgi:hypothetical protein
MKPTATIPSRNSRIPVETLTIRMAVPADAEALRRLASSTRRRRPRPCRCSWPRWEASCARHFHSTAGLRSRIRSGRRGNSSQSWRSGRGSSRGRRAGLHGAGDCAGPRVPRPLSSRRHRAATSRRGYDRPDPMSLAIHLLGRPQIECDGEPVAGPRGHKAWGLVAYFLLSRVRSPSREHLAELLFTGADDPLGSLRWNLAELRRALGAATLPHGSAELALPPGTFVDVDALTRGTSQEAVAIPGLGRELLEGMQFGNSPAFETWLLIERRRLLGAARGGPARSVARPPGGRGGGCSRRACGAPRGAEPLRRELPGTARAQLRRVR